MSPATRSGPTAQAITIGMLGVLAALLLYPIWLTVRGAFAADIETGTGWTFDHIKLVFIDPIAREGLINAFEIAAGVTLLSLLMSVPLALLSGWHDFVFKRTLSAMMLAPLILPPFVGAIGLKAILGREGALNTLLGTEFDVLGDARYLGVVVVEALHLFPIVYLNAAAALANIDPAMRESAEGLGASPWRRFFTVTLPLIRPGLFAGGTIVFIWSFTELGTPLIFDYDRVTPVQIFNGLGEAQASAQPYALTVVMLIAAILLYTLGKFVFGRSTGSGSTRATRAASAQKLTGIKSWLAAGAFLLVIIPAILPHIAVLLNSFAGVGSWYQSILPRTYTTSHYEQALGSPESFGSITNSLQLSILAVMLNLAIGVLAGYIIARTRAVGRGVLDSLCMLPLAVPGLVMAFGYVAMTLRWPFGEGDLLNGTPFDLAVLGADPNPFPLLVIAYAVRRLPYVVRSTVAGLEQTPFELEEAAINLGASKPRAVVDVVIPLIVANLVAAALLVFAFSMLEVSDSLLLAQKIDDYPVTKMIFEFVNRLGDGPYVAAAMGVWGMGLLTVTLGAASVLLGRKMGAVFRV